MQQTKQLQRSRGYDVVTLRSQYARTAQQDVYWVTVECLKGTYESECRPTQKLM